MAKDIVAQILLDQSHYCVDLTLAPLQAYISAMNVCNSNHKKSHDYKINMFAADGLGTQVFQVISTNCIGLVYTKCNI